MRTRSRQPRAHRSVPPVNPRKVRAPFEIRGKYVAVPLDFRILPKNHRRHHAADSPVRLSVIVQAAILVLSPVTDPETHQQNGQRPSTRCTHGSATYPCHVPFSGRSFSS